MLCGTEGSEKMQDAVCGLFRWVCREALPLWSTGGVDSLYGGFVERIEPDGTLISDVRRARLVARQIYVFRLAADLGWPGPGENLVRHGLKALLDRHVSADDIAIPCYIPVTAESRGGFDLYDQAFVLFGLSNAARVVPDAGLEQLALRIVARMRQGWQHAMGGFAESQPPRSPLKANPHMHLFEAAQSWLEVSGDAVWSELATEIAELCLSRFIAPATGALHEFFDTKWQIERTGADVVEPGHQSEWAWLLMRWFRRTGNPRFNVPARRLFEIAENEGCNATQNRLINELDAGLAPKWEWMRLWPQTERLKSLIIFAEETASATERADFEVRIGASVRALMDYCDHPVAGSWWEHIDSEGRPVNEPARASSLYHIMGAVGELSRYTGLRLD
jgi:mannose/cellobiose epimerase-like protein (N-acyl-D-glucosamine 2-epimerase family)